MRYCLQCGSEYQDDAVECADCKVSELVSEQELHRRGQKRWDEIDTRRFVPAGTAEDFLTSRRFTSVMESAHIPVFPRSRHTGTVDALTESGSPWWEILVPEEHLARASELIRKERMQMEAEASDAAKAAEEEEEEQEKGETPTSPSGRGPG